MYPLVPRVLTDGLSGLRVPLLPAAAVAAVARFPHKLGSRQHRIVAAAVPVHVPRPEFGGSQPKFLLLFRQNRSGTLSSSHQPPAPRSPETSMERPRAFDEPPPSNLPSPWALGVLGAVGVLALLVVAVTILNLVTLCGCCRRAKPKKAKPKKPLSPARRGTESGSECSGDGEEEEDEDEDEESQKESGEDDSRSKDSRSYDSRSHDGRSYDSRSHDSRSHDGRSYDSRSYDSR
ncbi:unnamed protein product [Pseudo-nitzschia multistriata]|uniref:Uncharacterized protein n=1 Tax=Pseudo-nitzschia multistriata TaxID=183589 RepID=A0A448ZN49_9STRA|nr:unnamed protein product [Pseudo-nitzschia multistriata]